jgi:hypothetical protein
MIYIHSQFRVGCSNITLSIAVQLNYSLNINLALTPWCFFTFYTRNTLKILFYGSIKHSKTSILTVTFVSTIHVPTSLLTVLKSILQSCMLSFLLPSHSRSRMSVSQEESTPKVHTQLFASRILSAFQNIKYRCYIAIRISTEGLGIRPAFLSAPADVSHDVHVFALKSASCELRRVSCMSWSQPRSGIGRPLTRY